MARAERTPEQRRGRNRVGGAGIGGAVATVGAAIATHNGIAIDPATTAAGASLFTALFGWIGGLFD